MKDSLLVALRNYRPRVGRDPVEDFITEAFAWTLRQNPTLGAALVREVHRLVEGLQGDVDPKGFVWDTQHSVPSGRVDMVALRGDQVQYIFEHKVWTEATADQVDRYRREIAASSTGDTNPVTVLITGDLTNYTGPSEPGVEEPDARMNWAEVVDVANQVLSDVEHPGRVRELIDLLIHEGLGPQEPLSEPILRAFTRSRHTIYTLYDLMDAVGRRADDWAFAYDLLPDTNAQSAPNTRWQQRGRSTRLGRIAMYLYSEWTPQLLFGLIIDESDINVDLVDPEAGPHLAVFIGLPYQELKGAYNDVVTHPGYAQLCTRLKREAPETGWTVHVPDHQNGSYNPYHPLVLQQPLAYVLRRRDGTFKTQIDAVRQKLAEGVERFLSGGEMSQLRPVIQNYL